MQDYARISELLSSDLGSLGRDTMITSDMDVKAVRCLQLRKSFYKKLSPLGDNKVADEAALDLFLRLNRSIPTSFVYPGTSEIDSIFWDYFKNNFQKTIGFDAADNGVNFDFEFIKDNIDVGPGANVGCDAESFYTKLFCSKLTSTNQHLFDLYRGAISDTGFWADAEKQRFSKFGFEIVEGSKLFFAPKAADISRTCCTEPILNMFFQKALGAFMEVRLAKHFGISLDVQPVYNRELARIGSIDGSFGTIDMKSASDSIQWSLIEQIACGSGKFLSMLRLSRCENSVLPDGTLEPLRMISTMGNGFTFPLQTIIFACTVRSVYQMMNLSSSDPATQFGVFGDDIIVRREAYDSVIKYLSFLGFTVNVDKSFNTGLFRESCGYDWYSGSICRGIYIRTLENVPDVYSAINRLNRWSAIAGVPLRSTIQFLLTLVRINHVPFSEADDAGLKVPFESTQPRVTNSYWFAYKAYQRRARRRAVPDDDRASDVLGYADFNPHGWALTFLGGYARRGDNRLNPVDGALMELDNNPVAWVTMRKERDANCRIKVVRKSIPFWDWSGPQDSKNKPFEFLSYGGWKAAVAANV
jgi:hypothetical protein